MIQLTADEARVLGVLIEKAMTTPEQYPLSQNAVVNGANQKSNRDPVLSMSDAEAFDALEGLRGKGLLVRVTQAGSRVDKFRHTAGDVLHARPTELALLAELMLRGPQTLGELRGRASRMQPFESLETVKNLLEGLMMREEPIVLQLPPSPGSRAERYVQLLAPDAHPFEAVQITLTASASVAPSSPAISLSERVTLLESEVRELRAIIQALAKTLGEPDPFATGDPIARSSESQESQ